MFKLIFFLLLCFQASFSQESVTNDSISGIVKYEFIKPSWNGDDWKAKSYNSELQFNSSESIFFHNKFSMLDGEESKAEFSEKGFAYKAISADEEGYQIYRNFETKEIFFRIPKTNPLDPISIEDEWIEINWKTRKKTKTVLGYNCQKAVGEFRGRTYEVWFTKEIPVTFGPWKLFGLPGLILEGKDIKNQIKFIATNVCYPCRTDVNVEKKLETKHMQIQEYVKYKDHIMENVEKEFKSTLDSLKRVKKIHSSIEINLDKSTTKKDIEKKRKFVLEIIYEWENKQKYPTFIRSSGVED